MTNLIKLNLDDGWVQKGNDPDDVETTKLPIGLFSKKCKRIPNLRYNQLTKKVEQDSKPVESSDIDLLYVDVGEKGWEIPKSHARDALVRAAKEDQYHPVKEYLEYVETLSNPVDLDKIATNYLGTSKARYDLMLKATLVGACQRIFEPGCKFDYVCVLKGQQGIRKSTFFKLLAGGHFNSTMPSAVDKDCLMLIGTTWFFALEELDSVTGKFATGKLKNLISSQEDHYRPPYGYSPDKFPRPSIFVGTTNTENFLLDDTGSRRFWVIECPQDYDSKGETIDTLRVGRDRDRIWCAAMKAYRNGFIPMLDWATEKESFIANYKFKDDDVFKSFAYESIMTRLKNADPQKPFTSRQVLIEHHLRDDSELKNEDLRQMGIVLKELGCKKGRRVNGSHTWYIPTDWSVDKIQ